MTLDFTKDTIVEAGKIVMGFYGRARSQNKSGAMNFVTEADIAADKFIKEAISKKFPAHKILSEEDEIHESKHEKDLWIIDPLDGTTNYKFQIPFFSISMAYVNNGEVTVGAVYDPIREELFWAERGKGAYLNGKKLTTTDNWSLQKALVALDGSYELNGMKEKLAIWSKLDQYPVTVRLMGSAVLAITYIAANRINLYFSDYVYPWDIAASSLIVQEAGGKVLDFDKKPFKIFTRGIIASSPTLLSEFQKLL